MNAPGNLKSTQLRYIDTHCHLNFPDYDVDREEVIRQARDAGVGMIIVGTDRVTSKKAIEIAELHENIWAIVGLHPIHALEEKFDYEYYTSLAQHPKVVGIGECGYDYFRVDMTGEHAELQANVQHEVFLAQIDIANKVKKPLMLHLRNNPSSGGGGQYGNAYANAIQTLKSHAEVPGNAHFFAGSSSEASQFLDLGFNLSFTGVITFARSYDDVVKMVPLDRIMSETDSPYVTPTPHRGERNQPLFVTKVVQAIATIRGERLEEVLPQLVQNAQRMFEL